MRWSNLLEGDEGFIHSFPWRIDDDYVEGLVFLCAAPKMCLAVAGVIVGVADLVLLDVVFCDRDGGLAPFNALDGGLFGCKPERKIATATKNIEHTAWSDRSQFFLQGFAQRYVGVRIDLLELPRKPKILEPAV